MEIHEISNIITCVIATMFFMAIPLITIKMDK